MKIAICLFGYTGSTDNRENITSEFDPLYSFNINQNKFYKDYDIDFFIHSWSTNYKSKLIELYNQKEIICEKQPNFLEIKLNDYNLDQIETYEQLIKKHKSNILNYLKVLIVATNSRWTSNCKALKLMQNYKLKNNCNYDLVIQMRLDLIFYNKLNLTSLDKNIFFHPIRDHEKEIAINDYFISNFENAISFSDIVNNLTQLSIRAPCAAKQFLDKLNIKHQEFLMFKKDFNILRIHKEKNVSNSSIHTTKVKKNNLIKKFFYRLVKKNI